MMEPLIAPSILSADPLNLERDITLIAEGGADFIHVDVMDGHYVPNLTFGPPLVRALSGLVDTPLDVHLMITNAEATVDSYLDAGASVLTVHAEAVDHLHRVLGHIRAAGREAGVSINPGTPVSQLADVVHLADLILIMSVNPGFGGQSYIPQSARKVAELKQLCEKERVAPHIEVDGGITVETAPLVTTRGADVLVAGSAVFGTDDPVQAIADLRRAGAGVGRA